GLGIPEDTPCLEVWNKADALAPEARATRINQAARDDALFLTSALTGEGMEALLSAISAHVTEPKSTAHLALTHSEGRARAWLYEQGVVQEETLSEDGSALTVEWTEKQRARFTKLTQTSS
ncbi:MAG: GTPase HflX, partial [Pseudomonadota bacterium]